MSVLNKILKESKVQGVETPAEGANLYDKGIQKETPSHNINVSSMPSQSVPTTTTEQDDDHYGFVHESAFGTQEEKPELPFMGYSEEQAYLKSYEQRTNMLDFMQLPEEASDLAKTAAYNSSIKVRDYTAGGEFLRSFAAGVGQVLIGLGDTLDWLNNYVPVPAAFDFGPLLGTDMNISLTGGFRSLGEEMESWDDKIDMSGLEEGSYKQLLNPKFWYTKAAKQIPNLLTFIVPGMGGARAGKAVMNLPFINKFGKATIFDSSKVGKNLKFWGNKGGGNASSIIVKGEDIGQWFGGAMGGNFAEGAMLAGQAHREVLEAGGTSDQAAMAGWGVMKDNALWILADGLQYSILTKGLGGIGSRLKLKSGVNFKNAMSDFMIGSGVALTEGKIEELQEVYQDWRVNKRVAEARGEDYDVSYWDYYHSDEVRETRVISFGMGFGGAAIGIMANATKDGVNMIAERNASLDEKIESTGLTRDSSGPMIFAKAAEIVKKYGFRKGINSKAEQEIHKREEYIDQLIYRIIGNGEAHLAKANIQKEIELGKVTEKEGKHIIESLDMANDSFKRMGFAASQMKKITSDGRAELARISNILRHTKESAATSNEYYENQIKRNMHKYK